MSTPFVFDAHVDSIQRQLDLGQDLGADGPGQLDLVRGRRGGLGAVVLASWCEPDWIGAGDPGSEAVPLDPEARPERTGGAFERTMALAETSRALAAQHPELAVHVRTASDLEAVVASNGADEARRIGLIIGIEGGHSLESSLYNLQRFHDVGVRLLTLVWNNHLPWIRSCQPVAPGHPFAVPSEEEGMSAFGFEVLEQLNALGWVVDISHSSDAAARVAIERSRTPVIASHSGCRALSEHPRNLSDALLRQLADAGGVVGVVFHGGFLSDAARADDRRIYADPVYRAIEGRNGTEKWLLQTEYHQREAPPFDLEVVADHIAHAVDVAGVEHVGLGSDYDGIPRGPRGLETAADYPNLAAALARRGFTAREVELVMGGNMLRVFGEVLRDVPEPAGAPRG